MTRQTRVPFVRFIVMLVMVLGLTGMTAFSAAAAPGNSQPAQPVNSQDASPVPSETGNIAVFKTLCKDIGQQDTCKGRDDSLEECSIDFQMFEGEGTDGELVETVTVTLGDNAGDGGNTGSGSEGRSVSGQLPVGTFTLCEVEVALGPNGEEVPLEAFPRPEAGNGGSTGGTNQEQFGENCIVVELTPGTAELQFLDLVADDMADDGDDKTDTVDDGDDKTDATDDGDDNTDAVDDGTGDDGSDDGAVDDGTGDAVDDGTADDGTDDGVAADGNDDDDADATGDEGDDVDDRVSALPSTGQGSTDDDGGNTSGIVLLLGAIGLVALTTSYAWPQDRSS